MKTQTSWTIAALSISAVLASPWLLVGAQALSASKTGKCTTTPCPNTPSGEDPGTVEAREGRKIEDEIRNSPDDKERWASLIIFSSSTDKKQLTIPIVKAANFNVSLDPKKGWIEFSTPKGLHAFDIGSTTAGQDNPCSKYQIRVVEGGPEYALIKKTCPKQEYRSQRFFRGTDYFLYDMKSNTMREVWSASTLISTEQPFPSAKPELALKKLADGYQLDWNGVVVSDNGASPMAIHNAYRREKDKKGDIKLVCYDITIPSHPAKENEMCESTGLQEVFK